MSLLTTILACKHPADAEIRIVGEVGRDSERYGLIVCPECGAYRRIIDWFPECLWTLPSFALKSKTRVECIRLENSMNKDVRKLVKANLYRPTLQCEHKKRNIVSHWNRADGPDEKRNCLLVCGDCGCRRSIRGRFDGEWHFSAAMKDAIRMRNERGIVGGWEMPSMGDVYMKPLNMEENDDYIDGAAEKMGARILSIR